MKQGKTERIHAEAPVYRSPTLVEVQVKPQ